MNDEQITVKVNGVEYLTVIVEGVQRFPQNKPVVTLLDTGKLDLNDIWIMYQRGLFSDEEIQELYRLIGYSVCGFAEVFEWVQIDNPLWDDNADVSPRNNEE